MYNQTPGPAAFAFDIDGVLMRGGRVLPAAKKAMALLHDASGAPRYPIVYLTNSGGWLESVRAAKLSSQLGVQVGAEQVIQSHTPLRALSPQLAHHPVLLVGRGDLKALAAGYGLRRCLTVENLTAADPTSVPFAPRPAPSARGGEGTGRGLPPFATPADPIRAVLMLNDPADWYCALQVSLDVVLGRGVPGRRELDPGPGTPPVQVVFSNPDLEWAAAYPTPRLGGGAFAICLQTLYKEITGAPLPHVTTFGKPNAAPYELATSSLRQQARALGWEERPFGAIFAVGDNPEADVAGANAAGPPWTSVLVRSGVFTGEGNSDRHPAAIVVDDVADAVAAALHRSRSATWHSMR